MYCKHCGTLIDDEAAFCGICGKGVKKDDTIKIEVNNTVNVGKTKNKWIAFILALLGGSLGFHRFYEGKIFTGIIYLLLAWTGISTFFAVIDMIIILCRPAEYTV